MATRTPRAFLVSPSRDITGVVLFFHFVELILMVQIDAILSDVCLSDNMIQ
jgi:hypothetical protein